MNLDTFLYNQSNRCDAYQLLSTFYYPPTEDTLLKIPALQASLDYLCPQTQPHVAQMQSRQNLEQLQIDFSSLFAGPFKLLAPPYGSVYLEGKREVMGVSTLDARSRYKEAGLELSGQIKEAPDHIAIELEFVYYLIFKEIEVFAQADSESAINYLEKQKAFLERHLGRWITKFTNNIVQHATTDFYKHLAQATKIFVQQDFKFISEILLAQPWKTRQKQVI